jgi:hypothetical protein
MFFVSCFERRPLPFDFRENPLFFSSPGRLRIATLTPFQMYKTIEVPPAPRTVFALSTDKRRCMQAALDDLEEAERLLEQARKGISTRFR